MIRKAAIVTGEVQSAVGAAGDEVDCHVIVVRYKLLRDSDNRLRTWGRGFE
jgi:hypothetical protein